MDREIKAAFARAFVAHLRNLQWYDCGLFDLTAPYEGKSHLTDQGNQDLDAAIEQGLVAAFETADYCPSCMEIVPVRDIVLERCLDCWHKLDPLDTMRGVELARTSDGVDPDALARLERRLENPRG